ncbi:MAG: MgtC/SapB family protein [bacterium]|nr:MgtC/SapB family protein [bacterium]
MNEVLVLRELTVGGIVERIVLSLIIGGIIGLERGSKNQPAGFRTYMVVCLGASLVMMTNQYISTAFQSGDPSRLGAQVISGIGFLGAGSIMITQKNKVRGLTTAAGLWAAACIGLAIGIGFYEGAIAAGVAVLLVMTILQKLDHYMQARSRFLHLYLNFSSTETMNQFIEYCKEEKIQVLDMQISKGRGASKGMVVSMFTIKISGRCKHMDVIKEFAALEGVKYIEEV